MEAGRETAPEDQHHLQSFQSHPGLSHVKGHKLQLVESADPFRVVVVAG